MPRRKATGPGGSSAYQRRNARARALGYRNYYHYRTAENGKRPPSAPRLRGQELKRARGHAAGGDFLREIKEGELVLVDDYKRDKKTGQYVWVDLKVLDAKSRERIYRLRGKQLKIAFLRKLVDELDKKGAVISPNASFDLRKLVEEIDEDEPEDEDELEDGEIMGRAGRVVSKAGGVVEVEIEGDE